MDKLFVLIGAAALSGLIIWWFFGKKKISNVHAVQTNEFQTATITVNGGYQPNVISLEQGKPAKITFLRKDSSSCLEEVIMPDFGVSTKLPVGEPFEVTIMPKKAGMFTYTCGMRMFSGQVEVK